MIAVEHYIKELLFDNECVILPGFGALLSSYKSAYYNSIKSTYYPPTKSVAFNAALTNNDWHLANEISSGEGISKEEALVVIQEFISNIQKQMQPSESFKLEGVGNFSLNKEGAVSFVPSLNSNYFEESFGLEPVQISKVQVENKAEKLIKHTQSNKKTTIMSENKKVEENEKQSSFFIIAPILLLLIAGGAFTWFMVDKVSFKNVATFGFVKGAKTEVTEETHETSTSDMEHHATDVHADHSADTHGDENHDWADSHEEESHATEHEENHNWHEEDHSHDVEETHHEDDTHHEVAEVSNGAYHIVAGAFEIEDNANAFAQKISGAKIIHGNRYHMVILGSYDSESSATEALTSFQGEHGTGLWIFNK